MLTHTITDHYRASFCADTCCIDYSKVIMSHGYAAYNRADTQTCCNKDTCMTPATWPASDDDTMTYALSHRIGLLTARRVCQNHDSEAADTSTAFGKTAEAAGGCGRDAALRLAAGSVVSSAPKSVVFQWFRRDLLKHHSLSL